MARYHPRLLRFAESLVPSRAVAEEVVQDTWLGVVRGIDRFEGRSSVKTWLFRILVNRARSAGAREHRSDPLGADVLDGRFGATGAWIDPPSPWADAVEDRIVADSIAQRIKGCLAAAPGGATPGLHAARHRRASMPPRCATCSTSRPATNGCCCIGPEPTSVA